MIAQNSITASLIIQKVPHVQWKTIWLKWKLVYLDIVCIWLHF